MPKSLVYLQSGGPTAVINSSLYGAIVEAKLHPEISGIYGSRYGVEGLIVDNLIDLRKESDRDIELLKQTPGAVLGTTRKKLPDDIEDPLYTKIINTIQKHNIGYVFVNGGNDSMDTCANLTRLFDKKGLDIQVLGIPKTVDNDLMVTDHSLGYPSAAKHVINTIKEAVVDASCYTHGKLVLVEIMGRNAGWLAAAADLLPESCRPDLIFLPESKFDEKEFLDAIGKTYWDKGFAVVAVSEGLNMEREVTAVDAFGHNSLEGVSIALAKMIEEKLHISTRKIELSLPQRANPILVSKVDQDEAIACSRFAIQEVVKGAKGKMVAIKRVSNKPYVSEMYLVDVNKIANFEKKVPAEMIINNSRMSDSFRDYLSPLIEGEIAISYKNGIFETSSFRYSKVEE